MESGLSPSPRRRRAGRVSVAGLVGVLLLWASTVQPVQVQVPVQAQDPLDRAIRAFWVAQSDDAVEAARGAVVAAARGSALTEVAAALRRGRGYAEDVTTGRQLVTRRNRDGREFPYVVHVPDTYDAHTAYPLRVYLHGGVMRPKSDDGSWVRDPDRFLSEDAIVVFPTSWPDSLWWQTSQVENLGGLINDLKRVYNVNENRVFLMGVSDGATGVYYHAFKATTPWAGFLAFIGHPGVLANPASGVDGKMHVTNLTNKPFFIVNGGVDRLYPVSSVEPFIDLFERAGVELDFRPQPKSGHDLRWWPELSSSVDRFLLQTRRESLPDRLTWQTEDVETSHRAHWLVIEELGSVKGEGEFESTVRGRPAFQHVRPSGRLDLTRVGNTVTVTTKGVRRYTLLLSPEQFDFGRPIRVVTNGQVSHDAITTPDLDTMLRWAAIDQDRTMLFGAELLIEVTDRD